MRRQFNNWRPPLSCAVFGTAASDRIQIAPASSINNLAAATILAWVFPTSFSAAKRVIAKDNGGSGWLFAIRNNSQGFIYVEFSRSVTTDQSIANNRELRLNQWAFIGASSDKASAAKLYAAEAGSIVGECTYSTQTFGSGTYADDSATNLDIGNHNNNNQQWNGNIAWIGLWNRVLSMKEIQDQQFNPQVTSGCVGFWEPGARGNVLELDRSGYANHGTHTGTKLTPGMPVYLFPDSRKRFVGSAPAVGDAQEWLDTFQQRSKVAVNVSY